MLPKVLLIDDDHDPLDILELLLFKDYNILTAMNGFEGLKKAQDELPDLIITDIMMPIMDGIRLFNQLKRADETRHIPIIAITSFKGSNTDKSLLSMGFKGVISKPLDKNKVAQIVKNTVKNFVNTEKENG